MMAISKNLITSVLLGFLVAVTETESKVLKLFLNEATFVYDYHSEVRVGLVDSESSASQYSLKGKIYVTPYDKDPSFKNAYLVTFQRITTSMQTGSAALLEQAESYAPIPEAAKDLEEPFLAVYDDVGQPIGMKFAKQESIWSQNMKFAWISMFQINSGNASYDVPVKTQSYNLPEKTVHGECMTSYDVSSNYSRFQKAFTWVVTKFSSPVDCSSYKGHRFDSIKIQQGDSSEEKHSDVSSQKVYEFEEDDNNSLVLLKLIAHEKIYLYPSGKSDTYYTSNNVTYSLERIMAWEEYSSPAVDFSNVTLITDWTYQSPKTHYAENAALDVTNGRHVVNQDALISEVQKVLNDSANYFDNKIEARKPNGEQIKTINKIRENLSFFTIESFEKIFSGFHGASQHQGVVRSLFLGVLPQVGTTASSLFLWNLIKKQKVSDNEAVALLVKLPFNVREPSVTILAQLEPLVNDTESLTPKVRKSAILAFSTLVFRTFNNKSRDSIQENILQKYLEFFYNRLINEPTYDFKLAYISAISNIQVGKIHELLAPIVRGDIRVSNRTNNIRFMAMLAIQKSLESNYTIACDIFWPIVSDYNLPLKLRIAGYDYLLHNARSMADVLRIYWFMVNEKSEHFYNYHVTKITNLANSSGRRLLRFLQIRKPTKDLSAAYTFDRIDRDGNGLKFDVAVIHNEVNNVPEVFYVEYNLFESHRIVSNWDLYLHVEGMKDMMQFLRIDILNGTINQPFIYELFKKFVATMASIPDPHMDVVLFYRRQSIMSSYYNHQSLTNWVNDIDDTIKLYATPSDTASNPYQVDFYNVFDLSTFEQYAINDMGVPISFYGHSPAVFAISVSRNQISGGTLTKFDVKLWLVHETSAGIYNPITDTWHSVEQSSIINADASVELHVNQNPLLEVMKLVYPKYWNIKFTEADAIIYQETSASIKYNDTYTRYSTYDQEVSVPKYLNSTSLTASTGLQ